MRRLLIFCIACVAVTIAYASFTPSLLSRNGSNQRDRNEWVEERVSNMTLKEKIAQLFIYTVSPFNTQSNKKIIYTAVKDYKVGGLLFSGGQLTNQALLTNYAQSIAQIPLFISFDGEWGLAMRLKNMPTFPRNRVLGAIQDNELIYEYGREVARQCREIGVHINFAPVADIDNNPLNPVINTRSFGGDVRNVAEKVIAYSRGLEDGGVLSVSKHFPGHGDTNVDSHKSLPILNFDRQRLDSVEFVPFRQAVKAGLGGMMVGHLNVPALGAGPASLSKPVINVLKDELGFDGLIFTDALLMKGVANNDNLCSKALIAGNDILLVPNNLKKCMDDVLMAVKEGKITEKEITDKCRKVLTYKYILGLNKKQYIQIAGLEKRIKSPESTNLITKLYKAAITVLGNKDRIIPFDTHSRGTIMIEVGKNDEGCQLYDRLKESMAVERFILTKDSLQEIKERIQKGSRIIVVVNSLNAEQTYSDFLTEISTIYPVVYVYLVPLKSLTNKSKIWKDAKAVILGHTDEGMVQEDIADILVGNGESDGKVSVAIDGLYKPGDGVDIKKGMHISYVPEEYGMNSKVLAQIDSIALKGIKDKAFPGCQVVIMKDGIPIYDKAFGTYTYKDERKVTQDNMYDIASLTKTTATLLAVMKLYDEGKFGLTDKVSKYVPQLRSTDKDRITVEELLLHQSGLLASLPFYKEAIDNKSYKAPLIKNKKDSHHTIKFGDRSYAANEFEYKKEYISNKYSDEYPLQIADSLFLSTSFKDNILQQIIHSPLKDRKYVYSCLNFMLLKEMVENITKIPLDEYLQKEFYKPMGLQHITYNPLEKVSTEDVIPTVENDYFRKTKLLQGFVHDEAAAFMGGVSGNAGLFANALDVANVYEMIINEGEFQGNRYLSKETCDLFLKYKSKISRRGLGFDKPDTTDLSKSPCAIEAPASVIGHTGFTGTCAWADPDNRLVMVFLSNRINPSVFEPNRLSQLNIRPRIQEVMYKALIK